MLTDTLPVLIVMLIAIAIMVAFSLKHLGGIEDMYRYVLGRRQLSPAVAALSAEASDMSAWLFLGYAGAVYSTGISGAWIGIGLGLGTIAAWLLLTNRLRVYSEVAANAITLPHFLQHRFGHGTSRWLRVIPAVFMVIFFTIYTSSGFIAGGKLLSLVFGWDYANALFPFVILVTAYTLWGGFYGVSQSHFVQGIIMLVAAVLMAGAALAAKNSPLPDHLLSLFMVGEGKPISTSEIISSLGWGLGYFGQPHIIARFMGIKDPKRSGEAAAIGIGWVVSALGLVTIAGLLANACLGGDPSAPDTVLLRLATVLLPGALTGIVVAGVLAAAMSTITSQMLVAASSFAQDICLPFMQAKTSYIDKVFIARVAVLYVSVIGLFLAVHPSDSIFAIVSYAWAGLGATIGPALLMSLYWRRMTQEGAFAGIIVGGLTVLLWKSFSPIAVYELVPAFLLAVLAIVLVSIMTPEPSDLVCKQFDGVTWDVDTLK